MLVHNIHYAIPPLAHPYSMTVTTLEVTGSPSGNYCDDDDDALRRGDASSEETVQLLLLANDDYCGMLIGRDGRSLRHLRDSTQTRISFAKYISLSLYDLLSCLFPTVVYIVITNQPQVSST